MLMTQESHFLKEIDSNQLYRVNSKQLTPPPVLRISKKKQAEMDMLAIMPNVEMQSLSYIELQTALEDYLNLDGVTLHDMQKSAAACGPSVKQIEEFFDTLLGNVDLSTARLLQPIMGAWGTSRDVPTSLRIVDILRCKRAVLVQGMGASVQDFMDWLVIVHRLRERLQVSQVRCCVGQLANFEARAIITEVASTAQEGHDGYYTDIFLAQRLYLTLWSHLKPHRSQESSITGRYYVTGLNYLIELDESFPLRPFPTMPEITPLMRSMLCEWLFHFSLSQRYSLKMETCFLGIALLDRFLFSRTVSRDEYFLYGCAALLLASKNEEMYSIPLRSITDAAHGSFTTQQLLNAEKAIVAALDFRMSTATISQMANSLIVDQHPVASEKQKHLLFYITASLCVHTHLGKYRQGLLAAAAVHLSRVACGVPTGEPCEKVRAHLQVVSEALQKNEPRAKLGGRLWRLFSDERFSAVSQLALQQLLNGV